MNPREGMFIPTGEKRWSGNSWYYKIIKLDDDGVTVHRYDSSYSEDKQLSYSDIEKLIAKYGLFERTGIYQFDRTDDPALKHIKFATRCPQAAGQRIYELEQEVAKLRGMATLQ